MTEDELRAQIALYENGIFWDNGPRIVLPKGDITLTSPLQISNRSSFELIGQGSESTRIIFQGDSSLYAPGESGDWELRANAALHLTRSLRGRYGGFTIECDDAHIGVNCAQDSSSGNPIPSENEFFDIEVNGDYQYGFFVDSWDNSANNEFHKFVDCRSLDADRDAFFVWGSQAHRLKYINCQAIRPGRYGMYAGRGQYYRWENGYMEDCGTRDFNIGGFWFEIIIDGLRTSGSKQLIRGTEGSPMPVVLFNCNWSGSPNYYGVCVSHVGDGPVTIRNCEFRSENGNPIILSNFDSDVGIFNLHSVSLIQVNPENDDRAQKPVIYDEDEITVYDGGVISRNEDASGNEISTEIIPVAPADDVSRGRISLPSYSWVNSGSGPFDTVDWQDDLTLPLSNVTNGRIRSWSIAATINLTGFPGTHPEICNPLGESGFWLLDVGGGNYQVRWESVGLTNIDTQAITTGVDYRFCLVWDRDFSTVRARFNTSTVKSATGQTFVGGSDNKLYVGTRDNSPSPGDGRFSGTFDELSVWDRALSEGEINTVVDE